MGKSDKESTKKEVETDPVAVETPTEATLTSPLVRDKKVKKKKLTKTERREERKSRWTKKRTRPKWSANFASPAGTDGAGEDGDKTSEPVDEAPPSKKRKVDADPAVTPTKPAAPEDAKKGEETAEEAKKKNKKKRRSSKNGGGAANPKPLHERISDMKEHPAITYLITWQKDHDNWKFQKAREIWVLLHMYDRNLVDKKRFKIVLDYLVGLKGKRRQELIDEANEFAAAFEKEQREPAKPSYLELKPEEKDEFDLQKEEKLKGDIRTKYKRCMMVVAVLSAE